ncbi:hypothetical protein CHELA1G11_10018 [Hyphomicrobiales bacterium]|nr:hypothetical protein CHELA1G11_10018 [Hyphomicrobiales bacterium]CAH1677647.1 hypothetical protein CHELA1G2_14292 [Hyphomicrobiales bacterium]
MDIFLVSTALCAARLMNRFGVITISSNDFINLDCAGAFPRRNGLQMTWLGALMHQ